MSIRKVRGLEADFSIIPNATVNDALSWEAIGMLAYLASKPDDWEVSVAQLVKHSKLSGYPSGRDKTYRILKELQEAGYLQAENARENGKFSGIDYIVSASKLPQDCESSPLPAQPYTDEPDTAEPTQQSKESYKGNLKQTVELNSTDLPADLKKPKRKRKKHDYPEDFEAFFKLYPKTNGSKLEALKAWKRLTKDEKDRLYASVKIYKEDLARETWRQPMIPARYIREEHFLVFYAPEGVLKPSERVYIDGKGFDPEALVELCTAYFRSSVWKYERLLGPAPDTPETIIPAHLISEAQKIVNGSAKT